MENSNSSSSSVKTKGYNRRTRPAGTTNSSPSSVKTNRRTRPASTTSTYRRRRQPTSENDNVHNNNDDNNNSNNIKSDNNNEEVVSIPIPTTVSSDWLLQTAPIALARHLMYVRGLWPMSVQQLLLLLQQEGEDNNNNNNNNNSNNRRGDNSDCKTCDRNNGGDSTDNDTAANKRRRMNNKNTKKRTKINPSLRRKQTKAMDQITRLCDEWRLALTVNQQQQKIKQKLPLFLLISLGPSYGQSRELYLLDFQSLIDDDGDDTIIAVDTNEANKENNYSHHAKEQKLEATLMRKLVGALMNAEGDNSLSNSLPCKSSPRFRLWFTAGFKITAATTTTNDDISWIPRTRFPLLSKKIIQSKSSSRKQSLVTIRFHRRQQQQQQHQHQHQHQHQQQQQQQQQQNSLLEPTSEQLTWMSLTTGVKGFRL
jgi:hypothetical protein